jgi:hypothetical protein
MVDKDHAHIWSAALRQLTSESGLFSYDTNYYREGDGRYRKYQSGT